MMLRLTAAAANALPRNFAMKATLCGYALNVTIPTHMYTPGKMEIENATLDGIRGSADGTLTVHDDSTATFEV